MNSELFQVLNRLVSLNEYDKQFITKAFKSISLEKNEFFLREGEVCRHVGFLKKGLVRYFVYKNDEESTFEFTSEGEFIADYNSFNNGQPSLQNIEAIEKCELLVIL